MGFHHGFTVGLLLQAPQRRLAGQGLKPIDRRLQGIVVAQIVVVIEVFVPGGQGIDPLRQQHRKWVLNPPWITPIWKDLGKLPSQAMLAVHFPQQQKASIRGDMAAGKISFDEAAGEWRKGDLIW